MDAEWARQTICHRADDIRDKNYSPQHGCTSALYGQYVVRLWVEHWAY